MSCSGPVALALLLALPGSALTARTVALRNDPIAIRLEVHQPTAVVFPEAVAAVPTGADPARLSLDYDGPYLFLQPREPGVSGLLFVVGASGRLYGLRFTVATPADDMVTIEPATASITPVPSRALPPLDLLKALRFGTVLPGVTTTTLSPFQSPDARVQVLSQHALALDVFLGVVVTITSVHPEPLELDLRVGVPSTTPVPETLVSLDSWPLPPGTVLKAVAAEDERLGPGGDDPVVLAPRKEALMPLFVTHLLQWTRRHPVLALLLGGGLGLIVYWQMVPSPGMPVTQKLAQARTVPGLSGERVTLEKTLLDVQRENEQLRLSLDEHRHTLVRLEQAQQRQERERQDQLAAQERRLEEALQRAQAPPPAAPPQTPRPAALPRLAPPMVASAPASPAPTIRILRSDKPPSSGGPGPTLPRADAPYLPPGSYAVGTLVTGVFATSRVGGALPVLFAVSAPFAGPFHLVTGAPPVATALPVQGCLVLGKAQADLAALRVVVQLTTLSCVFPDGQTFERPLVGYATGQDGTLGLPGRLETREGAYLAKTFLTSLLAGAGEAFALAKRTVVVTPFGGTISTQTGNVGEMAGYAALAQAAARLSEWYLGQADKLLPVLWAESGMPVRLVLQEGVALDGLPTTATLMQGGQ